MKAAQIRTTMALLGVAGTVVATAVLADRATPGAARAPHAAPARAEVTAPSCGPAAPARATTKLGPATLTAGMSAGTLLRGAGGEHYASFEIATDQLATQTRPPLNLALVIDRSGSMSGDRIVHAKRAANGIIDRLSAQDRVALIQYDDRAQVVVGSLAMEPANKQRLRGAIEHLTLGGSTNLHAGMMLGRDEVLRAYQATQVSRVILLSDGQANSGVVDPIQIADAARAAANRGVRITSVGLGLDYNEDLMEAIAEAGRGQYHYVKMASDLDRVIAGELAGIQATVATSVELRLSPACAGVEIAEVHGYESRREGETVVVPMADLAGGDLRKLLVSLKVPDAARGTIATVHGELVYKDASGGELRRTAITLGVDRTDDAAVAAASVDTDVMAQVLQLDAARSMRQAAQAYERGDRDGALQVIEHSTRQLEAKRGKYKIAADKAAPALEELDAMATHTRAYAPGSSGGKDLMKATKQKARVMSKGGPR